MRVSSFIFEQLFFFIFDISVSYLILVSMLIFYFNIDWQTLFKLLFNFSVQAIFALATDWLYGLQETD